jgi:YHS domain-containing protein
MSSITDELTFMRAQLIVATLIAACLLWTPSVLGDTPPINEFCPVMPSQPALPEYSLEFHGKTIYFCCDPCRRKFLKDPQAYIKNLPQFEVNPAVLEEELETADSLLMGVDTEKTSRHLFVILAVTSGLLALWWPVKWVLRRRGANLGVRPLLAEIGVCVLVGSLTDIYFRAKELDRQVYLAELQDLLHFATFYDFGNPPVPAKPPVPRRLQGTFYRGNDERSPRLFNGGHYRTCTFQVSLCNKYGSPLNYGDDILDRGGELFIKLQIERAPFTPDFFWEPDNMRRYFLTKQCDPFIGSSGSIPDRVNLTTEQPMQRWSALFPLGGVHEAVGCLCGKEPHYTITADSQSAPTRSEEAKLEGIIYVCEQFGNEKKMVGARYHYAIQYDLDLSGGVVSERSDVWMGALYRTRKVLHWRLPLHEWFSHEPIPVLPRAMAHDPKLLGISDYTGDSAPAEQN